MAKLTTSDIDGLITDLSLITDLREMFRRPKCPPGFPEEEMHGDGLLVAADLWADCGDVDEECRCRWQWSREWMIGLMNAREMLDSQIDRTAVDR